MNPSPDATRPLRAVDTASAVDPELLQTLFELSPDAVIAVNRAGVVTYANEAARRITGPSGETVIDEPLTSLVETRTDVTRLARRLCAEGQVTGEEVEVFGSDEASRWVSVSARSLRDAEGQHQGAVLWLRDVSEERAAREELERQNAELEHYVHAVSHDLRSPLVSLLGFSKLLDQDYGELLDEKGRHFLHRIEQAGRTMEALINDLLELSRIGQTREPKAEVDLLDVLRQLQAEFKPRLDGRDVELVFPSSPPVLYCNRMRLYQLASNLIGNAIEHMGEVPGARIEVGLSSEGDAHHLTVSDNGRGIAEEQHSRIFELFHSVGPRRDGRRGTGVGLAIVRKIAETHGGRAWVESAPGQGSTFHGTLPAS